jgi:DNA-binding HxlR family transcriptional regulator
MGEPLVAGDPDTACAIERTLTVISDRWSFLILRESLIDGVTRFADFEKRLAVSPSILANRLASLVAAGVFERTEYRPDGSRTRLAYRPTPRARELMVVLGALQQWGDTYLARPAGPSRVPRRRADGKVLQVSFADIDGQSARPDEVEYSPPQTDGVIDHEGLARQGPYPRRFEPSSVFSDSS